MSDKIYGRCKSLSECRCYAIINQYELNSVRSALISAACRYACIAEERVSHDPACAAIVQRTLEREMDGLKEAAKRYFEEVCR